MNSTVVKIKRHKTGYKRANGLSGSIDVNLALRSMYHDFPIGRFKPGWQLFTLFFLAFMFGFAFTQVFQLIIAQLYGPEQFNNLLALSKDPLGRDLLRWSQFVTTAGVFLVPALAYTYYYDHQRDFTINEVETSASSGRLWFKVGLGIAIGVAAIPVSAFLYEYATQWIPNGSFGEALKSMRDANQAQNEILQNLVQDREWYAPLANLFVMAFVAAVAEELFFRAGLMRLILRWTARPHTAIWLTALIFGIVHFDFDGLLSRVLLGAAMGYLYVWSGHILVPIALHFAYNATALSTEMMIDRAGSKLKIDEFLATEGWPFVLVGIALSVVGLFVSYRLRQGGVVDAMLVEIEPSPMKLMESDEQDD